MVAKDVIAKLTRSDRRLKRAFTLCPDCVGTVSACYNRLLLLSSDKYNSSVNGKFNKTTTLLNDGIVALKSIFCRLRYQRL